MAETRTGTRSVAERIRPVDAGAPVVAAHFLDSTCCFVLGEEHVLLVTDGEPRRVLAHSGGILAVAADNERVVTDGHYKLQTNAPVSITSTQLAASGSAP